MSILPEFTVSKIECRKCHKINEINEETNLFEPVYFYCKYCDFEEVYKIDVFSWQSEKRLKEIEEELKEYLDKL